jgi:aspartyl-tRNA(Asn)/glutamyl-tRNA(Gln) amidotransferase subunit B
VESIRARLPELPDAKRERFARDYALSDYEANLLTETRARAEFFETCLAPVGDAPAETRQKRAKSVGNWLLGEFAHLLNEAGIDVDQAKIEPAALYDMITMVEQGAISGKSAKTVFEVMFQTGKAPAEVVKELGLTQISGEEEIEAVIDRVLAANAKAVEDYRSGKAEAVKFLVGQIMKETRGRANPGVVNELLQKKLTA